MPHFVLGSFFVTGVFGGGLPLFPPFLDMDAAPFWRELINDPASARARRLAAQRLQPTRRASGGDRCRGARRRRRYARTGRRGRGTRGGVALTRVRRPGGIATLEDCCTGVRQPR